MGHTPHKDLLGLAVLALALGRGGLGVDLLAVENVAGDGEDAVHSLRVGEGDESETSASLKVNKLNTNSSISSSFPL